MYKETTLFLFAVQKRINYWLNIDEIFTCVLLMSCVSFRYSSLDWRNPNIVAFRIYAGMYLETIIHKIKSNFIRINSKKSIEDWGLSMMTIAISFSTFHRTTWNIYFIYLIFHVFWQGTKGSYIYIYFENKIKNCTSLAKNIENYVYNILMIMLVTSLL